MLEVQNLNASFPVKWLNVEQKVIFYKLVSKAAQTENKNRVSILKFKGFIFPCVSLLTEPPLVQQVQQSRAE